MGEVLRVANIAREKIDGVWLTSFSGRSDLFTLSSVILLRNPQLNLGIGIVSPLTWHLTTIARASAALNEISPGRFRLGIGVGGLQKLSREGIVAHPIRLLPETFQILREMWRGKEVTVRAEAAQLTAYVPRYSCPEPVPIYFGVRGPRLLELVSRFADGVLLSGPRSYLESAVKIVRRSRSETSGEELVIAAWFPFILKGFRYSVGQLRRSVAMILGDTPVQALQMSDLPMKRCERIRRFVARRNLGAASKLVDDEIIDEVYMRGRSRSICAEIRAMENLGIDEVVAGPPLTENWVHASRELIESWAT